jgi:transposase
MSYALYISVKESLQEFRKMLKHSSEMMQPRLKMLIEMKKSGDQAISKRELMDRVGVCSQSIHNWRSAYKQGGVEALLKNGRQGTAGRSSVFTTEEHKQIEQKLRDPKNGLAGYVELQQWVAQEFKKEVKYNTLLKYCMKHFGSKVKVARKSHVKKDEEAVKAFKKNLRKK